MKKLASWTFVKFIFPYLLILATVSIFGNAVYHQLLNSLIDQAVDVQVAMLNTSEHIVDAALETAEDLGMDFAMNPRYRSAIQSLEHGDPAFYDYVNVFKTFRTSFMNSREILDFVIYFPDSSFLMTSQNMTLYPELYYNASLMYDGMEFEQWTRMLEADYRGGAFLPAAEVGPRGEQTRVVSYVQTIPLNQKRPSAVVQIFIRESFIHEAFSAYVLGNNGAVFILDDQGKMMTHSGNREYSLDPEQVRSLDFSRRYRCFPREQGGKQYVAYVKSESTGWIYASVLPAETVLGTVNAVRENTVGVSVGILILVLVLSVYFAQRHAAPVDHLMQKMRCFGKNNGHRYFVDGYDVINEGLDSLMESHDRLTRAYEKHAPYIVNNLILDLILGRYIRIDEAVKTIEETGITIRRRFLCVGVIKVAKISNPELQPRIQEKIMDVFCSEDVLICSYSTGQVVALFLSDAEPESFKNDIESFAARGAETLHRQGIDCFCVVGPVVEKIEDLPKSSAAALETAENTLFTDRDVVRFACPCGEHGQSSTPDVKQKIVDMVDRGEIRDLIAYLDKLNSSHQTPEEQEQTLENGKNSKSHEVVRLTKEYVRSNYMHSSLGLAEIADIYHISEVYFSQVFKAVTGENFSVYLENIRMEKARELLLYSDLSIENIAYSVGYNSINTFYKAFKRVNGVTPGNYKRCDPGKCST